MNKSIKLMARNKVTLLILSLTLIMAGISAQAAGILNSESGGYLVCVNSKTKVITHPGKTTCPKGSKKLVLGAQGSPGITGAIGLSGKDGRNGADGKDGKTLWNGVKDPENSWGGPGDMFINSVTKTLFGPKDLTSGWPAGVSMVGPQGERGLIGLTGNAGPQGPGGSGPTGPAGATGPAGTNGTNGSIVTLTCAQGGTCVIGDTGPGGGKVFYITPTPFTAATPWRYLEMAGITWSGKLNSSGSPSEEMYTWCNVSTTFLSSNRSNPIVTPLTMQTESAIGKGYANTQIMLRNCAYSVAFAITSYHGGGKADWFLPSKDELNQIYIQRGILGMPDGGYWSSSEKDEGHAWTQGVISGALGGGTKSDITVARPIRAF
jgi:hypothetical protein